MSTQPSPMNPTESLYPAPETPVSPQTAARYLDMHRKTVVIRKNLVQSANAPGSVQRAQDFLRLGSASEGSVRS
jgi:hypothetical protein